MKKTSKQRGLIGRRANKRNDYVKEYAMQGLIAGTIVGMSDVTGQFILGGKFSILISIMMFFYGFCTGMLCYAMYSKIEAVNDSAQKKGPIISKAKFKIAFYKMLIDQLIWSPVGTLVYAIFSTIIDPAGKKISIMLILENYIKFLLASYAVWPLVQMINFMFIPLEFRVGFMNTFSFLWNTYLKIYRHSMSKAK
ncbi:protein Mpv17 [Nematocida sp. AWRm80]|nr:protein Mpv17 [Nematocida sp. AWRm80]